MILFVAPKPALCYFAVRWLCARADNLKQRLEFVSRLHVLYDPLNEQPRVCRLKAGRIDMSELAGETTYSMVVVDESHHLYKDRKTREKIERYMAPEQRLILLSDVSQSLGKEDEVYPEVTPVRSRGRALLEAHRAGGGDLPARRQEARHPVPPRVHQPAPQVVPL